MLSWNLSNESPLFVAVRYGRVPKRSREAITSAEADQSSFDGTSASPGSNSSCEISGSSGSGSGSVGSTVNVISNTHAHVATNGNGSPSSTSTSSSTENGHGNISTKFPNPPPISLSPLAGLVTQTHLAHCIYSQDKVRDVAPRKLTLVIKHGCQSVILIYS